MRINTNINALISNEYFANNNKKLANSLNNLSSGVRINKASDDASGLAIADKLRTQASSVAQSINNANSAVALVQIADKAMAEQSNILDIVKTKMIQAKTDTTSAQGVLAIVKDIKKLLQNLNSIAETTTYNGIHLLQKSATDKGKPDTLTFQIGDKQSDIIEIKSELLYASNLSDGYSSGGIKGDSLAGNKLWELASETNNTNPLTYTSELMLGSWTISQLQTAIGNYGITGGGNIMQQLANEIISQQESGNFDNANMAKKGFNEYIGIKMKHIDEALDDLNHTRSEFGSIQNQLESSIRNMNTQYTNLKSAESIIRDTDYAQESANFSKQNIIVQAGSYALSQANQIPQNVLKLLQ